MTLEAEVKLNRAEARAAEDRAKAKREIIEAYSAGEISDGDARKYLARIGWK
jgi:RecA-family ATPase